ncbi:MAG: type II toxin-antitoxin system HicB family antitoxin [Thermosynechococcaceae cyanobacterium]
MIFEIELEQEEDGRWIAEIPELSGVMLYGQTPEEATSKVQALALRVIAERIESGETQPELVSACWLEFLRKLDFSPVTYKW